MILKLNFPRNYYHAAVAVPTLKIILNWIFHVTIMLLLLSQDDFETEFPRNYHAIAAAPR